MIVISFGYCWWSGLLEFLQHQKEDGCGVMKGDRGIVIEDLCEDDMQNLGGGLVQMLMRAGILFDEVTVVTVRVIVVAVVGLMYFFGKCCLPKKRVDLVC